jgi:putative ABC transport system permease protein
MARMAFSGLLNNGKVDVPIIGEGIEPTQEGVLSSALQMLAGRALAESDRNGMVLGEGLARSLGVGPGDIVTLLVSTFDGAINTDEFEVVGVFRSFSREYDQRVIKIALPAAQQLFGAPDASVVVVLLDRTEDTGTVLAKARRLTNGTDLVVKGWEEINDFYANTVALYERQFAVLKVIILAMVVLGVANAVNMSVFERTAEFGTMRALGNRGRFVVGLVLTECLLLGLAGAAVGVLIGASLAAVISIIGIPMPPPPNSNVGYTARIMLQPAVMAQSFVIGAAATFLSGVVPAVRARRVAIVDALRAAT